MGKQTQERKSEIVSQVEALLGNSQMVMVIDYKGITVSEMNTLRGGLRPLKSQCVVVKNTLMRRAIKGRDNWAGMPKFLSGSSAFIFVQDDIGGVLKVYQDFQKKSKKTELRGAAMAGMTLDLAGIKAVADLPSKEVLLAQVAGSINAMATRLAVSINGVSTQLVRVVNEVPASVGRVIQAVADQKKDAA